MEISRGAASLPNNKEPCTAFSCRGAGAMEVCEDLRKCAAQIYCRDEECKYIHAYPCCDNALMKKAADTIQLLLKELDQAVTLLKGLATEEGFCTGCIYDLEEFCSCPKEEGEDCCAENSFWEWRGIFEEEVAK